MIFVGRSVLSKVTQKLPRPPSVFPSPHLTANTSRACCLPALTHIMGADTRHLIAIHYSVFFPSPLNDSHRCTALAVWKYPDFSRYFCRNDNNYSSRYLDVHWLDGWTDRSSRIIESREAREAVKNCRKSDGLKSNYVVDVLHIYQI